LELTQIDRVALLFFIGYEINLSDSKWRKAAKKLSRPARLVFSSQARYTHNSYPIIRLSTQSIYRHIHRVFADPAKMQDLIYA
jgi:hypothetical protein